MNVIKLLRSEVTLPFSSAAPTTGLGYVCPAAWMNRGALHFSSTWDPHSWELVYHQDPPMCQLDCPSPHLSHTPFIPRVQPVTLGRVNAVSLNCECQKSCPTRNNLKIQGPCELSLPAGVWIPYASHVMARPILTELLKYSHSDI